MPMPERCRTQPCKPGTISTAAIWPSAAATPALSARGKPFPTAAEDGETGDFNLAEGLCCRNLECATGS